MVLPSEIEYQLNIFLKPNLTFDKMHGQFLINDLWLTNINENYFRQQGITIIENINAHLKHGKQTKEFIKSFIQSLNKRLDWYETFNIKNVQSIHKIIEKISETNYSDRAAPEKEKYSTEDILRGDDDFIAKISKEDNYYFHLYRFANLFDNFLNPEEIEKLKLHYVLELHYEHIQLMLIYLDSLLTDFDLINFSNFDFEPLISRSGFLEVLQSTTIENKISSQLTKVDLANLFYFLLDEKILSFHPVERQNQSLMKKFIEKNFTYLDENSQKEINNINKEFSKISAFTNSHLHKHFIDSLIQQLEARRKRF